MENKSEHIKEIDEINDRFFNEVADGKGLSIPYGKMKILQMMYKKSGKMSIKTFRMRTREDFMHLPPPSPRYSWGGDFARILNNLGKDCNEINKKLEAQDIFFPTYFDELPLGVINHFVKSEKSAIEIYSEVFSNKKDLDNLILRWASNSFFAPRMKILEKALSAHLKGDYELSVPIFLIHVEGILSEMMGGQHNHIKHKLSSLFGRNALENKDDTIISGADLIDKIIRDQIFGSSHEKNKTIFNYPNRHKILHGEQLDYCTSEYSTRCIVVLDYIRSEEFVSRVKGLPQLDIPRVMGEYVYEEALQTI